MKKILLTLMTMIVCLSIDAQVIKVYQNGVCTKTYTNNIAHTMKVVMNDNGDLLPGLFSISANEAVEFAKGNLYWDGSAYQIEANQTDFPTSWDANHVGHFYWNSYEDYQTGQTLYTPYSEVYHESWHTTDLQFWCNESHPIAFGDGEELYAIQGYEWYYLLITRNNASSLHTTATVTYGGKTYQNCLILAPDNYKGTLKSSYTLDEVNSEGLVCFPAAGYREGSTLSDCGSGVYYWAASPTIRLDDAVNLYSECLREGYITYSVRSKGMPVRLAKKIQKTATTSSFAVANPTMKVGETYTQTVNTNSDGAATYSSSDKTIATVNAKTGEVTAVAGGTAVITATVAGSSNYASTSASYTISVDYEYVNLGLSVNWAKCNVGAVKPEGFGLYFAWGETTGYTTDTSDGRTFDWTGYKLCNGSATTLTKFCTDSNYGTVHNYTELYSEYDAAYQNWGGKWRMPTNDQLTELKLNCYWEYTSSYNNTSVPGYIVYKVKHDADKGISKIADGTYKYINTALTTTPTLTGTYSISDTHIFLPIAGFRVDSKFRESGYWADYWTRSLNTTTNPSEAYNLYFSTDGVRLSGGIGRYYGFPVRAVTEKSIVTVSFDKSSKTLTYGDTYTQTATTTSTLPITYTSSDETIATVDATTGEVTPLTEGTATITATIATDDTFGTASYTVTVHEYVDLGLSAKWAICNVGTDKPEGYGLYYSWGETIGYSASDGHNFAYSTYKWCNGSETTMTKYCTNSDYGTVDGKTTLEDADDAANANWEGKWHMPSPAQWTELFDNCTWTYTSVNDMPGYKVTGPNGNSIFLPASKSINGTTPTTQERGIYWTNEAVKNTQFAYFAEYSANAKMTIHSNGWHFSGHTVRAVISKTPVTVSFAETSIILPPGDATTKLATTTDGLTFTYTSSNPSVATVNAQTGLVTAVAAGTATITATVVSGDYYGTATYTVTVPDFIKGSFSVSSTKKVNFTKGNLYWNGSAYKFEANQTDYPSTWNTSHVGHFTWTSLTDYQSGTASYMPYSAECKYSGHNLDDKMWCGEDNPLTVEGISDLYTLQGGYGVGWYYLINRRPNASNLYKLGVTVGTVANCLIIAPDDFTGTLQSSYTLDEVNSLGLVCLPPVGYRTYGDVHDPGEKSYYWSSSTYQWSSYCLWVTSSGGIDYSASDRGYGYAIRLVRTATSKTAVSLSFDESSQTLAAGDTYTQTATTASEGTITYTSSNPSVATVDATTGVVTAVGEGTATITATIATDDSYGTASYEVNVHEYIELGLSVKWAKCNIGAVKPEGYGLYFAWGETTGYTSDTSDGHTFGWSDYKWSNGGADDDDTDPKLTKYNQNSSLGTVDTYTTLELADDAARVNWGLDWRMPTATEREELTSKCTWTWTTQNGINGYTVTGPNGNSIFLPASGYRRYEEMNNQGTEGDYWSSSLNTDNNIKAYDIQFTSSKYDASYSRRFCGQSVRAVASKKPLTVSFGSGGYLTEPLHVGSTTTNIAKLSVSGLTATVTYTSSDPSIATVDATTGQVTAVGLGDAKITATVISDDYYGTGTYTVRVVSNDVIIL